MKSVPLFRIRESCLCNKPCFVFFHFKQSNSESIGGRKNISDDGNEVEVSRWDIKRSDSTFGESEVWMNDGSIEGKVPPSTMNKKKNT